MKRLKEEKSEESALPSSTIAPQGCSTDCVRAAGEEFALENEVVSRLH